MPCSGSTLVWMFGYPFLAHDINTKPGWIYIWAAWIFFCIGVTFLWGILLVFHSSLSALGRDPGIWERWLSRAGAGAVCLLLLVSSELQVSNQCVLGDENTWGFGQVSAVIVGFALVPYHLFRLPRFYLQGLLSGVLLLLHIEKLTLGCNADTKVTRACSKIFSRGVGQGSLLSVPTKG